MAPEEREERGRLREGVEGMMDRAGDPSWVAVLLLLLLLLFSMALGGRFSSEAFFLAFFFVFFLGGGGGVSPTKYKNLR